MVCRSRSEVARKEECANKEVDVGTKSRMEERAPRTKKVHLQVVAWWLLHSGPCHGTKRAQCPGWSTFEIDDVIPSIRPNQD